MAELDPEEIRQELRRLAGRAHWSRLAALLLRVERQGLWRRWRDPGGEPWASMRRWAEDELGLGGAELVRWLRLGQLMEEVAEAPWAALSLSRARELLRLRRMGLGPARLAEWAARALRAPSAEAFRAEVARALGQAEELFVRWVVRVPAPMVELLRAALERAARTLGEPGRGEDPDVAFRALERIVAEWMAGPPAAGEAMDGEPEALGPGGDRPIRQRVLDRDGWRCRNPVCRSERDLEVDHVVPRSQGGPDTLENLVSLCRACHALKHSGVLVVIPDGAGGFRIHDTRRVLACEVCGRRIERGELVARPTPRGALTWVRIGEAGAGAE